jgi:hypothetical protein
MFHVSGPILLDTKVLSERTKGSGWTVATRNTRDFAPLGVKTFDPWKERL